MSLTLSKPRRSRKLPRSRPASRARAWSRIWLTSSAVRSAPVERGHAGDLGVGVAEVAVQPLAAQHQQAAVLALGLEEELGPLQGDLAHQQVADGGRLLGGQAAGPAVGDDAVVVEGAEVDPGGDVAGLELEADAGRGQGAAADLVGERVVAEQAEVAGARAGGDAPGDRVVQAQRALAGQPVEVGGVGLGELGAALGGAVAAEAVHHQQEGLLALGPGHLGHDGLLREGDRHGCASNLPWGTGPESTVPRLAGAKSDDPQEPRPVDRRASPPAPGRLGPWGSSAPRGTPVAFPRTTRESPVLRPRGRLDLAAWRSGCAFPPSATRRPGPSALPAGTPIRISQSYRVGPSGRSGI